MSHITLMHRCSRLCLSTTLALTSLGLGVCSAIFAQSPLPTATTDASSLPTLDERLTTPKPMSEAQQAAQEEQLLQKVNRSLSEPSETPRTEDQQLQQQQYQMEEPADIISPDPTQDSPDEFDFVL